jgi:hypothetical protein
MEWFDRRYSKIFDSGAKKIGIDLKNEENEKDDNN